MMKKCQIFYYIYCTSQIHILAQMQFTYNLAILSTINPLTEGNREIALYRFLQ